MSFLGFGTTAKLCKKLWPEIERIRKRNDPLGLYER